MRRFPQVAACFALLFVGACAHAVAAEAVLRESESLVVAQRGDLPIILSSPHGGTETIPDVPPRRGEGLPKGASGFFTGRDTGTTELTREIATAIENRFHKKPFSVIARPHRRYLDPNRPARIAYEDPDAKPVYDAYHAALDRFCSDSVRRFGKGLLLDIHGQGSDKSKVFRGTQDGKTVSLLKQRYGEAAITGEQSLFGRLKSRGWSVHPDPLSGREQSGFRGGYIVRTYGGQGHGIDAVQLEFGREYRTAGFRESTAATLAEAVVQFAADYLNVRPEVPPQPAVSQ